MHFCFDCDETIVSSNIIFNTSFELFKQGEIDKIYTLRDPRTWNLEGFPEILKKKLYSNWAKSEQGVWKCFFNEGADKIILYMLSKGHEVSLLTARPKSVQKDTRAFFGEYLGDNVKVYFSKKGRASKIEELQKIQPNVFVDDSCNFVTEAEKIGIEHVFLLSNEKTPWNKDSVNKHKCIQSIVDLVNVFHI